MNKEGFIKVCSAVMMKPEYVKERLPNGNFIPSKEMTDLLYEQTPKFREPIITFINEVVPYNWGIYFTPYTEEMFDAWIYCDTSNDYDLIVGIIKNKLRDIKFKQFYFDGSVNDIDNRW